MTEPLNSNSPSSTEVTNLRSTTVVEQQQNDQIEAQSSISNEIEEEDNDDGIDKSLQLESLDVEFQDVLSKDWDSLMSFDHIQAPIDRKKKKKSTSNNTKEDLDDDAQNTDKEDAENGEDEDSKPLAKKRTRRKKAKASDVDGVADENEEDTEEGTLSTKAKKTTKKKTTTTKRKTVTKKKESNLFDSVSEDQDDFIEEPHWYFVQVKPGCENHVATSLRNLAKSLESDDIVDVFVPTTTVMSLTRLGQSVKKNERYFPGYILILTAMNRSTYGNVTRVTHVQCFMGDSNREKVKSGPFRAPPPLKDTEMKSMFDKLRHGNDMNSTSVKKDLGFNLGDSIRVISGSMEKCTGKVVVLSPEFEIVRCRLNVFGRATTVELNPSQIELYIDPEAEEKEQEEKESGKSEKVERKESRTEKRRNTKKARSRIDGLIGKVNYNEASVASAADDLAAILGEDESDDWDPLAATDSEKEESTIGKSGKKRGNADSLDFDDGFASADLEEVDSKVKGDVAENKDSDGDKVFDALKKESGAKVKGGIDDDDDIFSWLDEKELSGKKTKNEQFSEAELDKLLDGGGMDDIWDAKDEKNGGESEDSSREKMRGDVKSEKHEEDDDELLERLKDGDDVGQDGGMREGVTEIMNKISDDFRGEDEGEGGMDDKDDEIYLQRRKKMAEFADDPDDPFFGNEGGIDDEIEFFDKAGEGKEKGVVEQGVSKSKSGGKKKGERPKRKGMFTRAQEEEFLKYGRGDDNLAENLDRLEPVIRMKGEESLRKIELDDDPPYDDIDYEAIVEKEMRDKKKKKGVTKRPGVGTR